MLRRTLLTLRVQSHQKKRALHPNGGTRFGRDYNRGFIRYGFGGFGMSVYSAKKDRRFRVLPPQDAPPHGPLAEDSGLSPTTRALSPNFRTFAMDDGSVLVTHPSHAQVLRWNMAVHKAECEATGTTTMDDFVNARIQSILADQTLENTSLSHWRRTHMWNLVKTHGRLHRRWGTPDSDKGARTTLYNTR